MKNNKEGIERLGRNNRRRTKGSVIGRRIKMGSEEEKEEGKGAGCIDYQCVSVLGQERETDAASSPKPLGMLMFPQDALPTSPSHSYMHTF